MVTSPLTNLLREDKGFSWGPEQQQSFDTLKEIFTTAPVLKYFDPSKNVILETDASNYVVAGVMSQEFDQKLHPVAYYSHKMSPAQCNYDIYDKELLAIVDAFKQWRHHLRSDLYDGKIMVYSDHKNLEHFMTTKKLNQRQLRWMEELTGYNFKIVQRRKEK